MKPEVTAAFSRLMLFVSASCMCMKHTRGLEICLCSWLFKKLLFTFIGPLYYIFVFCFISVLCL